MWIIHPQAVTIQTLTQAIINTAIAKERPNDYFRTIEEGKTALLGGHPDEAMAIFETAMKLDPSLRSRVSITDRLFF